MRRIVSVLALLSASPALAQALPPGAPAIPAQPPTIEQLLRDKIGMEIITALSCQANAGTLKNQLEQSQARIKELEAKEPKK